MRSTKSSVKAAGEMFPAMASWTEFSARLQAALGLSSPAWEFSKATLGCILLHIQHNHAIIPPCNDFDIFSLSATQKHLATKRRSSFLTNSFTVDATRTSAALLFVKDAPRFSDTRPAATPESQLPSPIASESQCCSAVSRSAPLNIFGSYRLLRKERRCY